MATKPKYQENKLAELMLYVAAKCETHAKFGSTKLNKILFFSDFCAYLNWGTSITGAEYRRRQFGPAATKFLPVQRKLVSSRAAALRASALLSGNSQQRLLSLRAPDLDLFDAREIALVDVVVEQLKDYTAEEVSDLSHKLPAWAYAAEDEVIPYHTVLLSESVGPVSRKDGDWIRSVAANRATATKSSAAL